MVFQTKIVEGNKNPNARVAWAGGGLLFLAMILLCIDGYQRYGFWLFGLALILLGVGAFLAKGDVGAMNVSDADMIISTEEIRIGNASYPITQLTGIVFQIEGYDGMVDTEGYSMRRRSGQTRGLLNGMNNYLNFRIGEEKTEWQFYLPDPQHVQQLGALFKDFYARRIPFLERSVTSDRTFLFEPVSEKEWEDRMIENGYQ
ncbi:MAG TPA: hypothetical protein VGM30_12785 [Puia sp.]|jgi:hypothetical protein